MVSVNDRGCALRPAAPAPDYQMLSRAVRAARLVAVAIVIGWSVQNVIVHAATWSQSDTAAYWNAAIRLREGMPLYPSLADASAADVYRYSPWFAWLWVPLTYLPRAAVEAGWSMLLLGATALALMPVLRLQLTSLAVAFLLGSFLVWAASIGNVQPLIVATLVSGLDRRSGPLWVGIAASLKAVPILYALLYVGRGEWLRAAASAAIAAVMTAPFLLYDLAHYPAGSGDAPSPLIAISAVLFGAAVVALAGLTVWLARSRSPFARLASACAVLTALPRITLLDLPQLLVGITRKEALR